MLTPFGATRLQSNNWVASFPALTGLKPNSVAVTALAGLKQPHQIDSAKNLLRA